MLIEAVSTGLRSRIRLRDGALVRTSADGATQLVCLSGSQVLGVLQPSQRHVLDALVAGDCDQDGLLADAGSRHGGADIGRVYALLAQLHAGNWLAVTKKKGGGVGLHSLADQTPLPSARLFAFASEQRRAPSRVPQGS